jgi:hypothetical protein
MAGDISASDPFRHKEKKKAARAAAFFEGRPKVIFSEEDRPEPEEAGRLPGLSRLFIQFKAKSMCASAIRPMAANAQVST